MNISESKPDCDRQPLQPRRIHLKDGRYMVFFEFGDIGDASTSSNEASEELDEANRSNV